MPGVIKRMGVGGATSLCWMLGVLRVKWSQCHASSIVDWPSQEVHYACAVHILNVRATHSELNRYYAPHKTKEAKALVILNSTKVSQST